jgi:hypothetical protein
MIALMRLSLVFAGLLAIPVGCGMSGTGSSQAVGTPSTPGWTGRTTVVGSHSTIAGDAVATEQQQKWPYNVDR